MLSKTKKPLAPSEKKRAADKDHARIRWVWRCNAAINDEPNETTDREDHAQFLLKKLSDYCSAVAFQCESAPTTGYLHYQGCMELNNKKRKHWILDNIFRFEYLAPMLGTPKQAWNYATKLETRIAGPWTYGEPYGENQKKPVQEFVDAVCAGMTDMDLVSQHPSSFLRFDADKIRQARRLRMVPPTRKELYGDDTMEVYVFYGNPGTGKSYAARALYPDIYTPPIRTSKGGNFWMTADANLAPVVLFDDFDGNLTLKALNQILDPYPQLLEKKGGNVWWLPKVVILTTNVIPGQWYNYDTRQDVHVQINRRITCCFDFNTPEGKAMTKGISVQELEDRYKQLYPIFEQNANQRSGHLPPIRISSYGSNQSSPRPSLQLAKTKASGGKAPKPTPPYTWDNTTRQLSVYKPLLQSRIVIPDTPPDLYEQDKMEQDNNGKVIWDEFGPTQPIDDMGDPETIPKRWF